MDREEEKSEKLVLNEGKRQLVTSLVEERKKKK
jgi:hypothetical protein